MVLNVFTVSSINGTRNSGKFANCPKVMTLSWKFGRSPKVIDLHHSDWKICKLQHSVIIGFSEYKVNRIIINIEYKSSYDRSEQESGQPRLPLTSLARRQHCPAREVQYAGPTHIKAAAPPTPTSPRAPAPSPAARGKKVEAAVPVRARRANPPVTTGKLTTNRQIE